MNISKAADLPENWERDSANQIAIDFDGVMHDPYDGPRNGECYGPPIPGVYEALVAIAEKYEIIVFTCKGRSGGPTYDQGQTGTDLVWAWLEEHGLKRLVKDVTATKPNAIAYIDDKSIRHTDWKLTMASLKAMDIM